MTTTKRRRLLWTKPRSESLPIPTTLSLRPVSGPWCQVVLLLRRFRRTAAVDDLQQAAIRAEEMVPATPLCHPERGARVNDWIQLKAVRHLQPSQEKDTEMAEDAGMKTGRQLLEAYEKTNSVADLENSIVFLEKAVEHIPRRDPDPDRRCSGLTLLGDAYEARYQRTGSTHDLQRAVEVTTDAINFMADTPRASDYLESLAASYTGLERWLSQRFLRFGSTEDVRDAVDAAEMAIHLTPTDDRNWPGRMNNLGIHLRERSEHEGGRADLDWAIECLEKAMNAGASSDHDAQAIWPVHLGILLISRFKLREAVEYLNLRRYSHTLVSAISVAPPTKAS